MVLKKKLNFIVVITILISACNTNVPKSNTLFSRSKEESIKEGFYKGKFKLFRYSGICDKISTLNCWAEMAWTTDNSFFLFPKKVKTDFYNFFIKINDDDCENGYHIQYKCFESGNWETASCIQKPNFGFYFQIFRRKSLAHHSFSH